MPDSTPPAIGLRELLSDGTTVLAVLLVWGTLALIGFVGVTNIGYHRPGSILWWFGNMLGAAFVLTGIATVLTYAIARGVQLSRH